MHIEEEKHGKWAVAAVGGYSGVFHVNTFVCERIERAKKWDNWIYRLRARDLHFTSYEGWTAEVWNDSDAKWLKTMAELQSGGLDMDKIVNHFYNEYPIKFSLLYWENLMDVNKLVYARLVFGSTFPLTTNDVIKFGMRHGKDYFDSYMEKHKLREALDMPKKSFLFPDKNGTFQETKDTNKVRRARQQLISRLNMFK